MKHKEKCLNTCEDCTCSTEYDLGKPYKEESAFDSQVGGSHYKDYAIEPYKFFYFNNIPHHKAAIIRRILRYDHPTGKGREDLEKIKHEISLIMELGDY